MNTKTTISKRIISIILAALMVATMFTIVISVLSANAAGENSYSGLTLVSNDVYTIKNTNTNQYIYYTGGTYIPGDDPKDEPGGTHYGELGLSDTLVNNDAYKWYIYRTNDNKYVFENAANSNVISFRAYCGVDAGADGHRGFGTLDWGHSGWGAKYYTSALNNPNFNSDSFTTTIVPDRAGQASSRVYIDSNGSLGWRDNANATNQNWEFAKFVEEGPTVPRINVEQSVSDNQVIISWNTIEGASSYEISRNGVIVGRVTVNQFVETVDYGSYTYSVKPLDAADQEIATVGSNSVSVDVVDLSAIPVIDNLKFVDGPYYILNQTGKYMAATTEAFAGDNWTAYKNVKADAAYDTASNDLTYQWYVYTEDAGSIADTNNAYHYYLVNVGTGDVICARNRDTQIKVADWHGTNGGNARYYALNLTNASFGDTFTTQLKPLREGWTNTQAYINEDNGVFMFSRNQNNAPANSNWTFVKVTEPEENYILGLTAVSNNDKDYSVTLKWSLITDAVSYEISRDGEIIDTVGAKVNTYTDKGVSIGKHTYKVIAKSVDGLDIEIEDANTADVQVTEYTEPLPGVLVGTYYIQNSFRNYPHWVVANEYNEYLYGTGANVYGDTQTVFAGATKSGDNVNIADINNDPTLSTDAYQWRLYRDNNNRYYVRNASTGLYISNSNPTNGVTYSGANAGEIAFYLNSRTIGYQDANSGSPIKNVYDGDNLFTLLDGTQVNLNQNSDINSDVFCASLSRNNENDFLSSGFDTSNGSIPTANNKNAEISIRGGATCNGGERWTFIKVVEESVDTEPFRVSIEGAGAVKAIVTLSNGDISDWDGNEDGASNDWLVNPATMIQLIASDSDSEYAFVGWQDVRNKDMISTDSVYSGYVGTKTHIRAIFIKKNSDNQNKVKVSVKNSTTGYFYQFTSGNMTANYVELDKGTAFAGSQVETAINAMQNEHLGYEVVGYELLFGDNQKVSYTSLDELKENLISFERDVVITVVYKVKVVSDEVTLTFVGDFGSVVGDKIEITDNGFKIVLKYNQIVRVSARSDNFSYWTYDGKIISNKKDTVAFGVNGKDATIVAVENDDANKLTKPTNTITGFAFDPDSDYLFLYEQFDGLIDKGFTIVEKGMLLLEDKGQAVNELTLTTEGVLRARSTSESDAFYARKAKAKGLNWYAQAYVIYIDSTGELCKEYTGDMIHIVQTVTVDKISSVVDFNQIADSDSAQANLYLAARNHTVDNGAITINATQTAANGIESVLSLGIEVPNDEKYIVLKVKGDVDLSNIKFANKPYSGIDAAVNADYRSVTELVCYGGSVSALNDEYQYWIIDREASGLTYVNDIPELDKVVDFTLTFAGTGSITIEDIFLANNATASY